MLASLREFGGKVGRRWYAVVVGVIGGVLGLVSAVYTAANPRGASLVSLLVWLPLLAGGFLVAIIWAFHDVRMERNVATQERDAVRKEIEDRFSRLRDAFQFAEGEDLTPLRADG